ncbi:hypothetical protein [uncultured Duncaniella sp.]|uniref:hypothetical protein n=1 Tax=Duncaniella dubosii TaxID=2518971 RepID=UPI000FB87947|nr:hypothetical protein [uncultured Duncaniella sp.]ROS84881.1 hypothetical protein EEL39_16185 [Muribaculaceae bacterium Isolate-080 (Janvier)]
MKFSDRLSLFGSQAASSAKSLIKVALQSHGAHISKAKSAADGKALIIMGNGPSLADVIARHGRELSQAVTMALNFAANAEEFKSLRPDFYLMADPHFFTGRADDPNVERLYSRLNTIVDWPMTLYVPSGHSSKSLGLDNGHIIVETFNFVGAEGFGWLTDYLYSHGLAMPRPRNVLIPAIMTAMLAGFSEIYLTGADHGWLNTLSVTDNNEVVSIQPHFYKDNAEEKKRVASVYRDVRLHDILLSFHLAFKSYHALEAYARDRGCRIYNSTPGSFIDAFERHKLPFEISDGR